MPGVGFRPNGSLTVALRPGRGGRHGAGGRGAHDAAARGTKLLDAGRGAAGEPGRAGRDRWRALHCERDAVVEPRRRSPALRAHLPRRRGYRFVGGRTVVDVDARRGRRPHRRAAPRATWSSCWPRATPHAAWPPTWRGAPLRRCRLQMMQTEPVPTEPLTTSIADGDSLRYYPAFHAAALAALGAARRRSSARHHMQLLLVQRATAGSPSATPMPTTSRSTSRSRRSPTPTCGVGPRRVLGHAAAAGASALGRRLLASRSTTRSASATEVRPRRHRRHRPRRPGHDAVAGHGRGDPVDDLTTHDEGDDP